MPAGPQAHIMPSAIKNVSCARHDGIHDRKEVLYALKYTQFVQDCFGVYDIEENEIIPKEGFQIDIKSQLRTFSPPPIKVGVTASLADRQSASPTRR